MAKNWYAGTSLTDNLRKAASQSGSKPSQESAKPQPPSTHTNNYSGSGTWLSATNKSPK